MTIIALLVPYVDRARSNTLAAHIRAGYPMDPQASIDTAANTYLGYLSVGALGVTGWLWALPCLPGLPAVTLLWRRR